MVKQSDSAASAATPPVFVIGLQRAPQRHQKTLAELSAQGIDAQLREGVDGGAAANAGQRPEKWANGDERCDWKRLLIKGAHLSFGEVGCYIAHYRLWRHAWESGWERIVVLECDARPAPGFKETIEDIAALDESHEFVNLAAHREGHEPDALLAAGDSRLRRAQTLRGKRSVYRCAIRYYGAIGYAINRAGLKKVLACAMPIKVPADMHLNDFLKTDLRYFIVHPNPIHHRGDDTLVGKLYSINRPPFWNWNKPKPSGFMQKIAQRAFHKVIACTSAKIFLMRKRGIYKRYAAERF